MTTNRLLPLRIGAGLCFCALVFGCGKKALILSDANEGQLRNGTSTGFIAVRREASPFRLTSSEGTELQLTHLDVRGVTVGPLAFTELHFTFKNAEPRVIEGRFRVALPENASVSRFAMKTSRGWQEGEMVEKARA
jgi:hypothetical protein